MPLELKIYAHGEGAEHGIRTFVVQSDRGVHRVAVDHGRQARIGREGEGIVGTARQAKGANRTRTQGHVPPDGDVVDVHVVAFLQPVVGDILVFDVLTRGLAHHIVVREARHIHVGQRGGIEDFVAESTVDLHGEIKVFVSQRDVRTEHHLGCGLSGHIAVAAVLHIDAAVPIEIGYAVAPTAVGLQLQTGAFGQIEHAQRLSHNLIDHIVVAAVETGAESQTAERGDAGRGELHAEIFSTQRAQTTALHG